MAAKPKGRPSKLSDKQWAEIQERLLAGESASSLAKLFKVGRSTITDRFSGINGKIKDAANQILEVENTLSTLPISARVSAMSLADELRAISVHLAGAGKLGAMTSHRLSGIANQQVDKIDDVNPNQSTDVLQNIAILTKLANDSSAIGMNLLNANKKTIEDMNKNDDEPPEPKQIVFRVVDASE